VKRDEDNQVACSRYTLPLLLTALKEEEEEEEEEEEVQLFNDHP
jgi:hypothetical protein